jgi:hypothetical protein
MVAYCRPNRGELLVVFSREGEDNEVHIAMSGELALLIALELLAKKRVLLPGDSVRFLNASDGVDVTDSAGTLGA